MNIDYKFLFFCFLLLCLPACHRADMYDIEGNAIILNDYQGKWVLINYWAGWCKPCLTEMPELDALYLNHKNKIAVFGVNYDQLSDSEIKAFASKLNIHFPQLRSFPATKYGVTAINTIPLTLIISPTGQLVKILHGPQTNSDLLSNLNM